MHTLQPITAAILLADGFSEEALLFAACLRESGFPVNFFAIEALTCYSLQGIPIVANARLTEQTMVTALVVPGGRACTAKLLADPVMLTIFARALRNGLPIITLSTATESVQRRFPQLGSASNHLAQQQQPVDLLAEQFIQNYGQTQLSKVVEKDVPASPSIWHDRITDTFWRSTTQLPSLTPLEHNLLSFMSANPQKRHTATELINATWPETLHQDGIATECLYRLVSNLRQKIEPVPRSPQHIRTWRGSPEGGYQFFPQGA